MMTFRWFTLIICSIISFPSLAQTSNNSIKGSIVTNTDNGIYTISAINDKDTIRATFADQQFLLPVENAGRWIVTVSSQGFDSYTKAIDLKGGELDLGEISLSKEKQVDLGEVVVKGKRCMVKRHGTTYEITNIEGTYLGDAGSILDMLQWTPGLRRDGDEGVKTINGATPTIYIDGKKVMGTGELKARPSSEVAKIEVIRNPGARYSSSTQAVVNITMRKHLKDYVGIRFVNELRFARRLSDDFDFNLHTRTGKLSTFWALHYENTNNKAHSNLGTIIDATEKLSSLTDRMYQKWKTDKEGYYTIAGLSYDLTPKSALSFQYNGNFVDTKRNACTNHDLVNEQFSRTYKEYDNTKKNRNNSHKFSLGYTLNGKNSSFDANAQYLRIDNKQDRFVMVVPDAGAGDQTKYDINVDGGYDLFNFESNYNFSINKANKFTTGVSTDYINNNSDYAQTGSSSSTGNQNSERKDFMQAAYLTYKRSFAKLTLSAGMRYEYTHTSLTNLGLKNTQDFSNFLPNIRLNYDINDDNQLELGYRQLSEMPNISQLNNIVAYSDMLHTTTGNPDLKTAIDNKLWAEYDYKDFSATVTLYNIRKSMTTGTFVQDDNMMILNKPINTRYTNQANFDLGYSTSGPKFNVYVQLTGCYTMVKYDETEGLTNKDQHNWHAEAYVNGSWKFYKTLEAYTTLEYLSPYIEGTKTTHNMWGVDLGVKGSFFKRKLVVAIDAKDLLRRNVTPYWSSQFANVHEWRRNYFDTRKVTLKVTYNINTIRSNYSHKTIGIKSGMRAQ